MVTSLLCIAMSPFSCQIEARQIDFWRLSQVEVRRIELYHFYPPRFIVAVNGRKAVTDSHAEISFTGIQPSVQEELPLLIPQGSLTYIHFHTYSVPIFEDLPGMQTNLTALCCGFKICWWIRNFKPFCSFIVSCH